MSAGQKRGGLGPSERWLWERSEKQESKALWKRSSAGLLTERAGIKRCIFPASSVVRSLRWATSRCSLLLSAAFFLVWHSGKAGNPYQARRGRLLSAAAHRPREATAGGAAQPSRDPHLSAWVATINPPQQPGGDQGDLGREVKGREGEALGGSYKMLTLSRIRTFIPAGHLREK